VYCKNEIPDNSVYCPYCGAKVAGDESTTNEHTHKHVHKKSGITYLLLAIFFGMLGVHRFYVKDIKIGLLYLIGTLFMLITLVPFILPLVFAIIPVIATIDGIIHVSDEKLYEKFGEKWK
jgi:TM2 domain-containing membrane protein YozV